MPFLRFIPSPRISTSSASALRVRDRRAPAVDLVVSIAVRLQSGHRLHGGVKIEVKRARDRHCQDAADVGSLASRIRRCIFRRRRLRSSGDSCVLIRVQPKRANGQASPARLAKLEPRSKREAPTSSDEGQPGTCFARHFWRRCSPSSSSRLCLGSLRMAVPASAPLSPPVTTSCHRRALLGAALGFFADQHRCSPPLAGYSINDTVVVFDRFARTGANTAHAARRVDQSLHQPDGERTILTSAHRDLHFPVAVRRPELFDFTARSFSESWWNILVDLCGCGTAALPAAAAAARRRRPAVA